MSRVVINLRDAITSGKSKKDADIFAEEGVYYGAREATTIKRSDSETPMHVDIYLDAKGNIVGAELRGHVLPINVTKNTSASKADSLKTIYREGRTAIISAVKLLVAGK